MVICHAIKGKFEEKSKNFHPFPMIFCQNAYFCSPLNDFLFSAHWFRLTFKGSNPRRKFSEDLEVFFEEGLVVKNIELYTPENVLKSSLCDTINKN